MSLLLHLLSIASLSVVVQSGQLSLESTLNPDVMMKNCTIGELCAGSINSSSVHYYAVQYTFNPVSTVRVTTRMKYDVQQDAPILVVVRQVLGVVSWTLPYAFANGMIYSSAARILCLHNEINRTHPHTTTTFIEISTSNLNLIEYSIQLDNITDYSLQAEVERSFVVSPSMPVYYKYTFPANVKSVFINIKSKDDLCTSVSVQSFYCPVYDVNEIGIRQGRYQTMSKGASFNIYSDEFGNRNEFLLVFSVKPTDVDCLNVKESAVVQPAGFIDVERRKEVSVVIHSTTYYNYMILTIFLTLALFLVIYVIAFIFMFKTPDIYDHLGPDNLALLEAATERELTGIPQSHDGRPASVSVNVDRQPRTEPDLTSEGEETVGGSRRSSDFNRQSSIIDVIETSERGFVTVNDLCVKEYSYLRQQFRIYPHTMLTIAIFYSLPVIQLVLQYQLNIEAIGNEDICYFNFLCTRQLFTLTAFNNVFSNIGYCALGVLFFIIVYRRDKAYGRFLKAHPAIGKTYGIPQHFGLFYAMAIGLLMEGIMSACYHVCPSRQNFQFDTSFMFIIAVLNLIKIYQQRHPDINPRSVSAFSFLALIIFITVIGVYFDKRWFWITYAVIHIIVCVTFTGKIYYMSRLKLSLRVHVHLYRLVRRNGVFSRPRYMNRMGILIPANLINIGFALYGAVVQPESFPNHLLFVFLGNLALYLVYYIIMKRIHREHFTPFSIGILLLSICFWSSSLYFFYDEVKSYEVQPAISRTLNQQCIVLHTYDAHDVWHILSSFGLFLSFLSILTIDDGVRKRPRRELAAF